MRHLAGLGGAHIVQREAGGDGFPVREHTKGIQAGGTEGFGQGLWDVKREEYRAKVPASQRKGTEEAARKAIQQTQAQR